MTHPGTYSCNQGKRTETYFHRQSQWNVKEFLKKLPKPVAEEEERHLTMNRSNTEER